MANTYGSLQSPPAGDSQVFDVGQRKATFRATGNSPTEHLNCRELPGRLGKAGGSGGARRAARSKTIQPEALVTTGTIHCVFTSGSAARSSSPQGYRASLPRFLPYTQANTVLLCAPERESSLFPNCNSLFLFHPRQSQTSAPLPLSDPEVKRVENTGPEKELLEKPGLLALKAADSLPLPSDWQGPGESTHLGMSQCLAQYRTVRVQRDWVLSLAV